MAAVRLRKAAVGAVGLAILFSALIALPKNPGEERRNAAAVSATAYPRGEARVLLDAANRERTAAGTTPLSWDAALAQAAQAHAELLASGGVFEHQLPGEPNLAERASAAGARFSYISENMAAGPDAETIHAGWMHSPGHRSNLLSPKVNAVGIAAVARGKQLYAVEDFARITAQLSLTQQEKKVRALLAARGWRISDEYVNEARKACGGAAAPRLNMNVSIMRSETSDLEELPASVERDLRGRRIGTASLGACEAKTNGGFSRYRIAVFLY